MPVSTWMTRCLLDPVHGYYSASHNQDESSSSSRSPIFGSKGDFITSPDISQVFGELLAIWFLTRFQPVAAAHQQQQQSKSAEGDAGTAPLRARLVELGPGRGALLSDMLRTFSNFPTLLRALTSIDLVETSPVLREMQKKVLQTICSKLGKKLVVVDRDGDDQARLSTPQNRRAEEDDEREIRVQWYDRPESVPVRPDVWTAVVAHEFFDALPINVFEKTGSGWAEVFVGLKRTSTSDSGIRPETSPLSGITTLRPPSSSFPLSSQQDADAEPEFTFVLSPDPTPLGQLLAASNSRFDGHLPGQRLEVSAEAWAAARAVGRLVSGTKESSSGPQAAPARAEARWGGAGLVVDYGGEHAFSDSFRAFRHHKLADPLTNPGKQDLTANVDFAHIRGALEAGGATTHPLATQQSFLLHLGLQPRLETLLRSAPSEERKREIEKAAERLVEGGKVGMGETFKVMGITSKPLGSEGAEDPDVDGVYPFGLVAQQSASS